ncbi:tRNA glutamyl-Q(34) synthetase GluQRS [Rhizobiales bacterium]|uniref:tRNA glutamyl-Q(34) synthetase GluQRS n=1 Tax=Hongsoonwoonella zoysiae TaxID=2821844 RepID=UPI001560AD60|nr:tRNA glutamyl-Q(34) synthetase GluQRS [Hongsoonwoonella zoysiae]NRG17073.1 tRNA glutamyl-Q(34) synthetase GluQRS [Hongsoonwoonella zoysiae]
MPTSSRPIYRFAPSPNGHLHLGHALSGLLNFEAARHTGGRFLLRIEDIDIVRCTQELTREMLEDLSWLGLSWEEPVRRQSENFNDYRATLARLDDMGLLYRGYLTRSEIKAHVAASEARGKPWPRDPDGVPLYPGDRAVLDAAEIEARRRCDAPFALRLHMKKALARMGRPLTWREEGSGPHGENGLLAAAPALWGDVVLARKDTPTSYHLSVVVDDALQGITQVMRGQDLFFATAVHRLLQALLDLPEPVYHHHRLILGPDGRKLSKSSRDTALRELRAAGHTPAEIRAMVGLR